MSKWIAVLCAAAVASGQSTPTFQVGTRLVTVDVLVRSEKGGAVRGLTKDDFTLQDKGKTQTIAVFSVTDTNSAPAAKSEPLAAIDDGLYVGKVEKPAEGWTAFMIELTYPGMPTPYKFTTQVKVVPDVLPFKDKDPTSAAAGQ